jgi:hypothetical protein
MSELTQCNFCNVNKLKSKYGDRLELTKEWDKYNKTHWTVAKVNGKRLGTFMEISERCVC